MKQPEDRQTVDAFENDRRRGRPSRGDALSDAQMAKRYRENRKAREAANKRDAVTGNTPVDTPVAAPGLPSYGMLEGRVILLNAENMRLAGDLQAALDKIAALEAALRQARAMNVTRHETIAGKKAVRR